ncbi:MAG: TatD family hydrolase [Alphaproteobacteria bacterium]|nr:TatD family hydrolase [Alphaproteobacteria bacterium]
MPYVDSHIHLQDYKHQDVKNVVNNAIKNQVNCFVNVSSHPSDWQTVAALAAEYAAVIPAFGVHPWYIAEAASNWPGMLEELLQKNPQAWVGECGIDRLKNPDTDSQRHIFETQAALAVKYGRPLIIHSVKADEPMREMFSLLPAKTVFHSYIGSVEWGREIQRHGFYIGLNFSILRKKNFAHLVQELNFDQVLLETDGPYQSPDKNSETMPADIPLLAAEIAAILGTNVAALEAKLYHNWQQFEER